MKPLIWQLVSWLSLLSIGIVLSEFENPILYALVLAWIHGEAKEEWALAVVEEKE